LPRWMHYYNWHRQHAGIDYQCPINTLGINMNNLLALHS
ncbi:MAG: IS481 family transposase, partial [Gammaproteobacteria bacterium]|nr:IS481 family transposase [Gammaproteobacteria bacterium]